MQTDANKNNAVENKKVVIDLDDGKFVLIEDKYYLSMIKSEHMNLWAGLVSDVIIDTKVMSKLTENFNAIEDCYINAILCQLDLTRAISNAVDEEIADHGYYTFFAENEEGLYHDYAIVTLGNASAFIAEKIKEKQLENDIELEVEDDDDCYLTDGC